MAGLRTFQNFIEPTAQDVNKARGDVPAELQGRYRKETRGAATLGFYRDERAKVPAFRDRGDRLVATRVDPGVVRDMVLIAGHRGWMGIWSRGHEAFRREAWVNGLAMGLTVFNYYGSARDIAEVERRRETKFEHPVHRTDPVAREAFNRLDPTGRPEAWMKIAEAVVKARLPDPRDQRYALDSVRQSINFGPDTGWEFYRDYARRTNEERRARMDRGR
jgi:hypothetical protein